VKAKTFQVLGSYVGQFTQCGSMDDLVLNTRLMMENVTGIVMPQLRLELTLVETPSASPVSMVKLRQRSSSKGSKERSEAGSFI
jgi:hypothetical protein